jgi:hypothetical protein
VAMATGPSVGRVVNSAVVRNGRRATSSAMPPWKAAPRLNLPSGSLKMKDWCGFPS